MNGILVVAKAPGYTSHDVVAVVRRLSGTRRAGHGGTLDPFASGVLPVFLGIATRLVEYHMADDKAYRATICFGSRSETDDRDGEQAFRLSRAVGSVGAKGSDRACEFTRNRHSEICVAREKGNGGVGGVRLDPADQHQADRGLLVG